MAHESEAYLLEHYSLLGNFERDFRNANLVSLVAKLVTGMSVVDIGCGAGFFGKILQSKGKDVVGIEPNEGLRAIAAKIHPDLRVIPGTAESIETLITSPVDAVCMLDVLEHIEDDTLQTKRVHAVLKKGGEFIIVVPAYQSLYGIRDKEMGHYRRYSKESLTRVLTQNGFKIKSFRYWNILGILPYLVSEKILRRPLQVGLREAKSKSVLGELMWKVLNFWMAQIENRFNFGLGLSIICVAEKV